MPAYRAKPPKGSTLQRGNPLANGLRLAYLLDEQGGTTTPDAVGKWPGSFVDTPTWTTGAHGRALSVNGTSSYVLVSSSFVPGGTSRTVAALIRSTVSSTLRYVFDSQSGRFIAAWNTNTTGQLGVYDGVSFRSFGDAPNDGNYHLVHWVTDGVSSLCRGYVDGVQLGTDQTYSPVACGGRTTFLADSNGPPATIFFAATVAGFWYWDRAMGVGLIRRHAADPFGMFRRRLPLRSPPPTPPNRSVTGNAGNAAGVVGGANKNVGVTGRPPNV